MLRRGVYLLGFGSGRETRHAVWMMDRVVFLAKSALEPVF
jgi:hypothetical protein